MSQSGAKDGKAGGWRWWNVGVAVLVVAILAFTVYRADLSAADFCAMLDFAGADEKAKACAAAASKAGGTRAGIAIGLVFILLALVWVIVRIYDTLRPNARQMAADFWHLFWRPDEQVAKGSRPPDRDATLDFLRELKAEGHLTEAQQTELAVQISLLADDALAQLRQASGLSDSPDDARADTAMAEAVEAAVEQGSDAQIEAMELISAGKIAAGLDRLSAAAEAANQQTAALWRQIGMIAYPVDTARALAAFENVLALGTRDLWDFIYLAQLYTRSGNLARSSEVATNGLAIAPRSDSRTIAGLQMEIAENLVAQGDLAGALVHFEAIQQIFTGLAADDPTNPERRRDVSVSLNNVGDVLVAQGDLSAALERFEASLAIAEDLSRDDPGNADWRRDVSVSLDNVGDVLVARGDLSGGLERFEASLAIAEGLSRDDPGNADWRRDVLASLIKVGDVLVAQGDLSRAQERFQASLAIAEGLSRDDPGNAGWRRDLSVSLERVGDVLVARGDLSGALERFEVSLSIRQDLSRDDPGNAGWRRDVAVSHARIALLDHEPRHHWRQAAAILEALAAEGRLAPRDQGVLEIARAQLAALD